MTRENAYAKEMREKNLSQVDYVRDRLHRFADSLTEEFTGQFEIRVPLLRGMMGEVSVVVTERQPKRT